MRIRQTLVWSVLSLAGIATALLVILGLSSCHQRIYRESLIGTPTSSLSVEVDTAIITIQYGSVPTPGDLVFADDVLKIDAQWRINIFGRFDLAWKEPVTVIVPGPTTTVTTKYATGTTYRGERAYRTIDLEFPGRPLRAFTTSVTTVVFPIWGVLLLLWAFPAFVVVRGPLRRYRRRKRGLCVQCAYNLTSNVSGICPECGEPCELETGKT